jgi:hypothetical protein
MIEFSLSVRRDGLALSPATTSLRHEAPLQVRRLEEVRNDVLKSVSKLEERGTVRSTCE